MELEKHTISEIIDYVEARKPDFHDKNGDWTKYGESIMNEEFIRVEDILPELEAINKLYGEIYRLGRLIHLIKKR